MTKRNKTQKPTSTEPHAAGCACGPCHNARTDERMKPKPKLLPNACAVPDGAAGRPCVHASGHEGFHSTGFRTFGDPKPLPEKPKRAAKAEKPTAANVCGNAARDPSTGKPMKGAIAKTCEREPGHEGPHRIGPHGDLEHVIEWDGATSGWSAYNRKAQRPMTLDDEPEDPESDDAALAAMDELERDELNDDAPEDLSGDEEDDPRPQWLREQTAQRDAAGRGTPAARPAPSDEEDDPEDYETRTDDDRDLARQQREAREAHAAELARDPEAADPARGRMDGKDCGAIGPRGTACVLDQEHDGEHRDYLERTWADRKPRAKKPQGDLFGHVPPGEAVGEEEAATPILIPPTGPTITCCGKAYEVHPAARIFPTPEVQYRRLVESIRTNGQKHAIELLDTPGHPVIDGCSRLRACEELGIEPHTVVISVSNPIAHVVAVNIDRRHLSESQRAMVGADLATLEHGTNQHDARSGKFAAPTQAEAAVLVQVSERLVRDAVRVKNKAAPEVAEAVRAGKLKVSAGAGMSDLTHDKQRELIEKTSKGAGEVKSGRMGALVRQEKKRDVVHKINHGLVGPMPDGPFGLIVVDYPWPYANSDQHEGSRGHMPYPPMPMNEIAAHAHEATRRAADDCVLGLWVTNAFVHEIGFVLRAWGFEHRTMFTWEKDRLGMGNWGRGVTEHLVIASRGAPTHTLNELKTSFAAPVRDHSEKPKEIYEMLEKHCAGPRLELFAIGDSKGWTTWGAEATGPATTDKKPRSKIYTETDRLAQRAV